VPKCVLCSISQKRSGIQWCQDSNLAEPEKRYATFVWNLSEICLKMFIMLHIPEALRHTVRPGLQPGWTRKWYTTFVWNLSQNVYYVAYPRSAQAYGDATTPTWLNQKKIYMHNVCLKFCLKMFITSNIQKRPLQKSLFSCSHLRGLQHGWTRKGISGIQMRVSTQLYYF